MLTFNLKKEWFEKIKSGEKTHEYRRMTEYWVNRINPNMCFSFKTLRYENVLPYRKGGIKTDDKICFACGYPAKDDKNRRIFAKVLNIYENVDGRETDLEINEPVFDIEFELIKE